MEAEKIYKKYPKEVREYMNNLFNSLEKQYGEISDEWRVSLDLIAYNYHIIVKCREDIEKNGFEKTDDRGRISKNPSLSTFNQAQGYLMKLLSQFGLNIMSKSKLKDMAKEHDNLQDLLE